MPPGALAGGYVRAMTSDALQVLNFVLLIGFLVSAVALVVVLILREFWCWWFKQTEQVRLLKSIDARLATLAGQPAPADAPSRTWLERVLNEDPQAGRTFS